MQGDVYTTADSGLWPWTHRSLVTAQRRGPEKPRVVRDEWILVFDPLKELKMFVYDACVFEKSGLRPKTGRMLSLSLRERTARNAALPGLQIDSFLPGSSIEEVIILASPYGAPGLSLADPCRSLSPSSAGMDAYVLYIFGHPSR